MMRLCRLLCVLGLLAGGALPGWAGTKDKTLDVYWVDVEGGAATLIVTPAGESILIDTGYPDKRDPARVHKVATEAAALKRIDHLVITHFHNDHFAGAPEISELIPIDRLYDNGVPEIDPARKDAPYLQAYASMKVGRRTVLQPGHVIPLIQVRGSERLYLRLLGTRQEFVPVASAAPSNEAICATHKPKPPDTSDNANSMVWLLEFGTFRFFVGGDLTWNTEAALVCPVNRVGPVDVYQVDHHGLDVSNNPVLVRSLAPTVSVMSNGVRKGCGAETLATLKSTPSIKVMYQVHKNMRDGESAYNAPDEYVANLMESCSANYIKMTVAPDGRKYTIEIPAKKHRKTYDTRRK